MQFSHTADGTQINSYSAALPPGSGAVTRVSIERGQEVLSRLAEAIRHLNIVNAAIISVVGTVSQCSISNMSLSDPRDRISSTYEEPLELAGVGEIVNGQAAIKCTFGREDGAALMGRMQSAIASAGGVNIYLMPSI